MGTGSEEIDEEGAVKSGMPTMEEMMREAQALDEDTDDDDDTGDDDEGDEPEEADDGEGQHP
jgi:hypothetical protein